MNRMKIYRFFDFVVLLCVSLVLETQGIASGEVTKHPQASESATPSTVVQVTTMSQKRQQNGCVVNEVALEDLQKTKAEHAAKEKELASREADLKAREKAFSEELKKLEQTRDLITKASEQKKKEHEEKVSKLVETFLTMSPKAASKILSTLDDNLAVSVLTQMETNRLAKILNVMDPVRSSQLSEMLVGLNKSRRISSAPHSNGPRFSKVDTQKPNDTTTSLPQKGGQKNDGRDENHAGSEKKLAGQQRSSSEKADAANKL